MTNYKNMRLEEKDLDYLMKYKDKLKKRNVGDVVESMIKLIKAHKMEGELK